MWLQKNRVFHITTLIVPKQESTSDSVRKNTSMIMLCYCYFPFNIDFCFLFLSVIFIFVFCSSHYHVAFSLYFRLSLEWQEALVSDSSPVIHVNLPEAALESYIYLTLTILCLNSSFCLPLLSFQCQTLNEEEIFEVQDKLSLFPLGWIHVSVSPD